MCKTPNGSKITNIFPQCLTQNGAKADLSSLYSQSDIQVEHTERCDDSQSYHLFARCSLPYGKSPYCGSISHRVHSKYMRTIADLSILGLPVIMKLEARKFFCDNTGCKRKTFAEQPGDEVFRYRRRTRRCEVVVAQHGLKTSSESARKLLSAIGVRVSGDTVLRDIHRMSTPSHQEVGEIGVDDWAFRKGATYGSIIVSLDTGEVIDLLGDRDAESFRGWLDSHAQVRVVSRDRSTDYSAAIAATGRNITEVADRFHLNMNMSDCVKKVISSHYEEYRKSVSMSTFEKEISGKVEKCLLWKIITSKNYFPCLLFASGTLWFAFRSIYYLRSLFLKRHGLYLLASGLNPLQQFIFIEVELLTSFVSRNQSFTHKRVNGRLCLSRDFTGFFNFNKTMLV